MMSRGGGIVPGAAPMGAGLVPSTGAAGAIMAGGPFPCPERGGGLVLLTRPRYHLFIYKSIGFYAAGRVDGKT